MKPQELFATQYTTWFTSVFSGHVRRASRIDPYQSSARDSAAFWKRLVDVESGLPVANQVVTDLSPAGLIERQGGAVVLTAFGRRVLRDWRRLGVANDSASFEVARATAMIRAGLDDEVPLFRALYERWLRLVALQPASYWLANKWRLTLPEYLDQPDATGFNPFAMLSATNEGVVGEEADWRDWATAEPIMAPPINEMISKVDGRRGRIEFCRGLELVRLSESDPDSVAPTLASWSTP